MTGSPRPKNSSASTHEGQPVLAIDGLTVGYRRADGWLDAVRQVSLSIDPGQVHGLVGESGSGKTTLTLAVMRHLGDGGQIRAGSIKLAGRELLGLSEDQLRQVWGSEIALVPQDPFASLNPSLKIGQQVEEALRAHRPFSERDARDRALELLRMVRLADPPHVASIYPHQISGGMQQRVLIAMALSTEPRLLVLDEPTTGLDATTEAVMLDLFRELMRERQTATLYVSHNLGVVARFADRVAVLYASELVEDAPTVDLFRKPLHPYTQGLMDSVPRLGESKKEIRLRSIQGQIPRLEALPSACVFAPRCPLAIEICREQRPKLEQPQPGRRVRCHRWPEILGGDADPRQMDEIGSLARGGRREHTLLLENVAVHYPAARTPLQWARRMPPRRVRALRGVDLELFRGRTLGLVGESGSGKTTLARAIVGLVEHRTGRIELLGLELPERLSQRAGSMLRKVQMVFQNPEGALNPYLRVGEMLNRTLQRLVRLNRAEAATEVDRLLAAVRLPPDTKHRFPTQLSGGEKQRVAIARAFASTPAVLLCDEPVSSLDVSVQASILNMLNELQYEHDTSLLFISHDIAVVGYLADDVGVLYLGQLMEWAVQSEIFTPPYHPYTEALLSAIPLLDPEAEQEKVRLQGEVPGAMEVPKGCPFHTRCPRYLGAVCEAEVPPWQVSGSGKKIFCHIAPDELRRVQAQAFILRKRKG